MARAKQQQRVIPQNSDVYHNLAIQCGGGEKISDRLMRQHYGPVRKIILAL
jgi:hypothetical protein